MAPGPEDHAAGRMKVEVSSHVGMCQKEIAHGDGFRLRKRIGLGAGAAPVSVEIEPVGVIPRGVHVTVRVHDWQKEPLDVIHQSLDLRIGVILSQQKLGHVGYDARPHDFVAMLPSVIHDSWFVGARAGNADGPHRPALDREPDTECLCQIRIGRSQVI